MQIYFFVMRRISCTNAVLIVSWSRNLCLKLASDVFWPHRWVGGLHIDAIRFGGFLELVSHISEIFKFDAPLLDAFIFSS